jgi:hypothetical protein
VSPALTMIDLTVIALLNCRVLSNNVVGPPCPHCQSPHTEWLEFASSKTFTVYRCFKCSVIWRVPVNRPKPE